MKKQFRLFAFFHLILWSVLPLLRANLPLDSIEAIIWGHNGGWGFDKHPPLSGWLADWAYQIFPSDFSIYLLSQIVIVFGLILLWRLGNKILDDPTKRFWAILMLEGVLAYTFFAPEFNVNILLLGLVPGMMYFFYRSVFEYDKGSPFAFGLFCGLAMLTKYIAGVFLVAFALYSLFNERGRRFLKSWKSLAAGVTFCAVIAPHVMWLMENDWITVHYALGRATKEGYHWWNHLLNPLKFIGAQLGMMAGLVLIFLSMRPKIYRRVKDGKGVFIQWMFFGPLVITLLPALLFGMKLRSMWGVPLFGLLPLLLMRYFAVRRHRLPKWVLGGWMVLTAGAMVGVSVFHISKRVHFEGERLAQETQVEWGEQTLDYVGGEMWLAGNASVYMKTDRPKVFIEMNEEKNPNLDLTDFRKKGGIIFAHSEQELKIYLENFPKAKILEPKEYILKNIMAETKHVFIHRALVRGVSK